MHVVTSKQSSPSENAASISKRHMLISLLTRPELYFLLLVTLFLHFAYIQTFEFDDDQVALLRMAHDALHYGILPAVSNVASINIAHPPGTIYLYMIPELFTANPLAANIFVAICTTIAVFLTYFFVHRYYGRVAAISAALLYATATRPLLYARFIWQPNLMPPFVILFMFALFEGVVRRRKGWVFPALVLLGILYQMHPTAILLAAPLCVAFILAPETFRWRDIGLALVCLLIIFSPYLLYEYLTKFVDVRTVLTLSKQPSHFDGQALYFYRLFLTPGDPTASYPGSLLFRVSRKLSWLGYVSFFVVIVSVLLVLALIVVPHVHNRGEQKKATSGVWSNFRQRWTDFHTDGYTCGLVLLLVWQIVPLGVLSRHSIALHAQYFFLLYPGPFILIGMGVAKIAEWTQRKHRHQSWKALIRYATYGLIALLVLAQFAGSAALVVDNGTGNFNGSVFYPYHNDLSSLQNALSAADQLAQQRHLGRVYITTDVATQSAFRYLTEGSNIPTTLFDASSCLVLPNPSQGAAVFLVGPYDDLTNAILTQLSSATLVEHLPRLGGSPFSLYVVNSRPARLSTSAFEGNLQAIDQKAAHVEANGSSWLVSQWQLLRTEAPTHLTTYNYVMHMNSATQTINAEQATCTLSSLQVGDQLLVATHYPKNVSNLTAVNTSVQYYKEMPHYLIFGPIMLGADQTMNTPWQYVQVTGGKRYITINV